jgi:succinate dehydrogenase flavin-adding protein (antitoxin of CptAB toxin-antitoxin module)
MKNQIQEIKIKNLDVKIDIMHERYSEWKYGAFDESDVCESTIKEYVKMCAEADANFFQWLIDKDEIDWKNDETNIIQVFNNFLNKL